MKKIKVKTLYLIAIVVGGLIGLGIGSTYAMFTTSIEIDNPISLSTTLTSESDIIETFDVEVAAGGNKEIPLTINNTSNTKLNYSVWYITSTSDVEMGTKLSNSDSSPSSSKITSGETKKVYVQIKNNSTNSIKVTLGVSSSTSNIVLSSSMTMVPNTELAFGKNLLEHITNLYNDNTKTTVTNNSIKYNYATSVNLMNDRLGSSTTDIDGGNIRYYGGSPNNYIYFNCSDYSNQNADTCELWRIIGVFDGKVKIIRNDPLEALAWDNPRNSSTSGSPSDGKARWDTSSMKTFLNEKYYNGDATGVMSYHSIYAMTSSTKTLDMSKIGIRNDITRNMISESNWRTGKGTTGYVNTVYVSEDSPYTYSFGTTYPSSWTGKIALPNLSDYGYAVDLSKCTVASSDYSKTYCISNNWMHGIITSNTWSLGVYDTNNAYYIPSTGIFAKSYAYNDNSIHPTLSLNTDILVSGKSLGTYRKPFKIIPKTVNVKGDSEDDAYLVNHIVNLYDNAEKTTVTNNGIAYNYATDVSLMNDRKGNVSNGIEEGNIRYYGGSPNNYIYFNCSDYSNQNADTCEMWRVIGVFDGKVKIIRNDPLEALAWDNPVNTGSTSASDGTARWDTSSMKVFLNEKYYNGDATGVMSYHSIYAMTSSTKTLDMSKIGIKNDITRNMISESTWRTGKGSAGYANVIYNSEDNVYNYYPSKWLGKVALLNLSDYSYAMNLNLCTVASGNYNRAACTSNNWLHSVVTSNSWSLAASESQKTYYIPSTGVYDSSYSYNDNSIYPTLYLKTDVMISKKTTGEYRNPYKIMPSGTTIVDNQNTNTLEEYIVNLYDNASKSTTTANSVTYNLASSVGLMNDRKGKLSTPLNEGNIRYYGANPNNYIYFNCTDYGNQGSNTCELWRVIGVFDGKVKIMRNEPLETLAWDNPRNSSTSGSPSDGKARWDTSSMKTLLNEKYYNGDTAGTIIYYGINGMTTITKSLDMSKIGIKNDITRNMIAEFPFRTGKGATGYVDAVYNSEDNVYSYYPLKWLGKIGLLNLSDYGYATDLSLCAVASANYGRTACTSNNWLYSTITSNTWSLDIYNAGSGYYMPANGVFANSYVYIDNYIYPIVYLKSSIKLKDGTIGTSSNPFQIEE